jgi:hypothetical protein
LLICASWKVGSLPVKHIKMGDGQNNLWIYEVNVTVDRVIEKEYKEIVKHHVDVITACPGFRFAKWFEQHDAENKDTEISWVIQYYAESYEAIENYFNTKAPELRAHTVNYGSQVKAKRRVLKPF